MPIVKIPWILTHATIAIPTFHIIHNYSCSSLYLHVLKSVFHRCIPSDSTQKSKLKVYFFVWVYFIHLSVHLFVLNVTLVLHFAISAATPQPHDREFSKVA